jgi:hypothetical protein
VLDPSRSILAAGGACIDVIRLYLRKSVVAELGEIFADRRL